MSRHSRTQTAAARADPAYRTPWLLKYVGIPIGGIALMFFFVSLADKTVDSLRLLAFGYEQTTANLASPGGYRQDGIYCFDVDGREFQGRGRLAKGRDDTVEIAYSKANPNVNRPINEMWLDAGIGTFIFVGLAWSFARIYLITKRRRAALRAEAGSARPCCGRLVRGYLAVVLDLRTLRQRGA